MQGLTHAQVEASREKYGSNALTEHKGETFAQKLIANLQDPMIKILCFALVINVIFTFLGQTEWYESVGIAAAVVIATFVSTYSEYKNEDAFQKLQEEASRIICKVWREGALEEVSINDLVVGDCVVLQTGDKVPADGVLIDGEISVDQAALNGEAREEFKTSAGEDYSPAIEIDFEDEHRVFRGSIVLNGNAVMQVSQVGDGTVYGGIAKELGADEERESPLKLKLSALANSISKFGYIGGVTIAVAYLLRTIVIANGADPALIAEYCGNWMNPASDVIEALMLAVIIVVMAVPEGLPLMIAIVSAMNMSKMLKDNVLVREINGIETAGSLNILFTDKTGTLTKGHLEVVQFIDGAGNAHASLGEVPAAQGIAFSINALNNNEALISKEDGTPKAVGGNMTDRALLECIIDSRIDSRLRQNPDDIVERIPFDSARKFAAVQLAEACGPNIDGIHMQVMVKGAPERLLSGCTQYLDAKGHLQPLDRAALNAKIDELAAKAIRVLAFAACGGTLVGDEIHATSDLVLIGLTGIRDDVRPESIEAIAHAHSAGVQVVMITGDRKETARAIAEDIGLLRDPSTELVLTSSDLAEMNDAEIAAALPHLRVIARALPQDKSRLVRIAQEQNLVVGMTGDGVNDSPALKRADVGFAMGSGTEVAKEAAEIVILDDNFNSIQRAILYGRTIFNSIRKFIVFQLTINVSAVLVSFIFPLIGFSETPLTITQILWINLVMDTLAALAMGGEPALERYMQEKPKRRDEAIVSREMALAIGVGAVWTLALSFFFLYSPLTHAVFNAADGMETLMTGYFCLFIFLAVFNAFNARTSELNLLDNIKGNANFLRIIALIVVVQVLLTYFGGAVFGCYGLSPLTQWPVVLLLAFTIVPVDLLRKKICS